MFTFLYRILAFIAGATLLILAACSSGEDVAGTGSSTGNAKVVGIIKNDYGEPIEGAEVFLIPEKYNPLIDGDLPDSMICSTNKDGKYVFMISDTGKIFNIHAFHPKNKTQLFICKLKKGKGSLVVPAEWLEEPGVIQVVLPDTVNISKGYIFIPGSMIFEKISDNLKHVLNKYIITIDLVPSADFQVIYFVKEDSPSDVISISTDFTVPTNATIIISKTGYCVITGLIIDNNGKAVKDTYVYLIDTLHNSATDKKIPECHIDTTNKNGRYMFVLYDTSGVYNIHAKNSNGAEQFFIDKIETGSDSVHIKTKEIKNPGTIRIILPDTVDTSGRYLFIPGTQVFKNIGIETDHIIGKHILIIDSVSYGSYNALYYANRNDPFDLNLLKHSFSVYSADTVTIGSFSLNRIYNRENSGLPDDTVYSIAIDKDGSMWFGTGWNGAVNYNGMEWDVYNLTKILFSPMDISIVLSIAVEDNMVWCGTHHGVAAYNRTSWDLNKTISNMVYLNTIYSIAIDSGGNKWFTRYPRFLPSGGVAQFNGLRWRAFPEIEDKKVHCCTVDKYNRKWIGTENGVACFNEVSWEFYNTMNSKLPSDTVYALACDNNGNIWMGTCNGEVVQISGDNWTVHYPDELNGSDIHAIACDSEGNVWFGTIDGLVVCYTGNKWINYNSTNSIIPDNAGSIHSIAIDRYDNTWIASEGTGVFVIHEK